MNGKINIGPSPEEQGMRDSPEIEIPKENLRECEPEIAEFEEMIVSFESTHSLEALNSIIELATELETLFWCGRDMTSDQIEFAIEKFAPEDAERYRIRTIANNDLFPIVSKLNALENETNISPEKLGELKAKYKLLSRAVGMIYNNKIDHSR